VSVSGDPALDELPRPLAAWDVRDAGWFRGPFAERSAWLKEHGLPVHKMYRMEFYPGAAVRIFCYRLNEAGRRGWNEHHVPGPHDHSACDAAREEPRDVLLDGLPPEELR
jgi:hypothetical protein